MRQKSERWTLFRNKLSVIGEFMRLLFIDTVAPASQINQII